MQECRDLMGNWAVWTRRVILGGRAGWPGLACASSHPGPDTWYRRRRPSAEPNRTTENITHPGAHLPCDQVCSERRPLGPSGWAGRPLPASSDRDALSLLTPSLAPPTPDSWAQTCSGGGGCATGSEPARGIVGGSEFPGNPGSWREPDGHPSEKSSGPQRAVRTGQNSRCRVTAPREDGFPSGWSILTGETGQQVPSGAQQNVCVRTCGGAAPDCGITVAASTCPL